MDHDSIYADDAAPRAHDPVSTLVSRVRAATHHKYTRLSPFPKLHIGHIDRFFCEQTLCFMVCRTCDLGTMQYALYAMASRGSSFAGMRSGRRAARGCYGTVKSRYFESPFRARKEGGMAVRAPSAPAFAPPAVMARTIALHSAVESALLHCTVERFCSPR